MRRSVLSHLLVALVVTGVLTLGGPAVGLGVVRSASGADAQAAAANAAKACKKKKRSSKKKKTPAVKPVTTSPVPSAARSLTGTFQLTAGSVASGKVSGSYFRMVIPGGSAAAGPFFPNPNSPASDGTYTLLTPGKDGGFVTGAFQEPPTPAFAANGNALANRIVVPTKFAGYDFSLITSAKDPQTGLAVPAPTITVGPDGKLGGQLRAWAAQWNNQNFNQGSPKPDGSSPGITSPVTGTFDATTKAFTLTWTSQVVGGPFSGFSGVWHLEGVFVGCGP